MTDLKNIPVTLSFDFNQFLMFFEQLPVEYKNLIVQSLEKKVAVEKQGVEKWENLKGCVLDFDGATHPRCA